MKRFFLALAILAFFAYSLSAQEATTNKLYLEITETGLPENNTIGAMVRVEVPDASAAATLRDELVSRFFAGKTYTAKLHTHRTDAPCESVDL